MNEETLGIIERMREYIDSVSGLAISNSESIVILKNFVGRLTESLLIVADNAAVGIDYLNGVIIDFANQIDLLESITIGTLDIVDALSNLVYIALGLGFVNTIGLIYVLYVLYKGRNKSKKEKQGRE